MSSGHISTSVNKTCHAVGYSYGEICVHCNCCGKIEKGLKMYEARLEYHQEELDGDLNFNNWAEGYPDLIELQKKNIKLNIAYSRAKIAYVKRKIKQLKTKQL